ncbi:amino acid permease [candidate division WOR-3 bacterium]|nr:amino acid permease [candidate division WOR-3 bacterium]
MNKKMHYNAIGIWSLTAIGIGGMIGAGIFSILGIATQIAGSATYISFLIAGAVALLCAYSYARLSATYPSAGGPVEFLVRGFGNNILSGGVSVMLWIGYVFALALYAKAFGGYAATFLSDSASPVWNKIFATSIVLVFTAINYIGAKAVGKSEFAIVIIKVGVLILFAVLGIVFAKPVLLFATDGWHAQNILFCAGIVFLAYEGFGLITNAGEDARDPKKTLPRALYLSVAITICIYIAVTLAVIGNVTITQIVNAKDYALAEAARPFLGMIGFKIIAVAALFSTASAINATLYGGANASYIIAKEGDLPQFFERKVWGKSSEGLFITSGLVIVAANLLNLEGVTMLGSASFLLIYAAVHFAHLRLYKQTRAQPLLIWLAISGCVGTFFVLMYYEIGRSLVTPIILAVVILASLAVESIYRVLFGRRLRVRNDDVR